MNVNSLQRLCHKPCLANERRCGLRTLASWGKKLGNIKVTESLHPSDKLAVLPGLAFGHELAS